MRWTKATLLALWVFSATAVSVAQEHGSANAPVVASDPTPSVASDGRGDNAPRKKKRKKKRKKVARRVRPPSGVHLASQERVSGGAMLGLRERDYDVGVVRASVGLDSSVRLHDLEIRLPIDVAHRQTFGASLSESRAAGAVEARYRFSRGLRVSLTTGVRVVNRPNWPDLRQPVDNTLLGTDRYSYWARSVGAGVTLHPARRHWLRASYEYRIADYATDPAFQAIAHPTHLAPFDHDKHLAELDYHYSTRGLRVGVGADAFLKHAFYWFSRDAHTGFTHASPNGLPANPLQELRRVTPRVDLKVEPIRDRLELVFRYAHELQQDPFQGYYSSTGPNPQLAVRGRPFEPLWLKASAELWWRTYGAGSYRAGIGHPELDDGDRRYDHRLLVELGAELMIASNLALTLECLYLTRRTNFPDYAPGVFPPTRNYTIDWDYQNLQFEVGVGSRTDWF